MITFISFISEYLSLYVLAIFFYFLGFCFQRLYCYFRNIDFSALLLLFQYYRYQWDLSVTSVNCCVSFVACFIADVFSLVSVSILSLYVFFVYLMFVRCFTLLFHTFIFLKSVWCAFECFHIKLWHQLNISFIYNIIFWFVLPIWKRKKLILVSFDWLITSTINLWHVPLTNKAKQAQKDKIQFLAIYISKMKGNNTLTRPVKSLAVHHSTEGLLWTRRREREREYTCLPNYMVLPLGRAGV